MNKKLVFDTLNYAKILEQGGIIYSDVHSSALAGAIIENIYVKYEVDSMFNAALERSDKAIQKMQQDTDKIIEQRNAETAKKLQEWRNEFKESQRDFKEEMLKIELRFEKASNRNLYLTISILGGLYVAVGAITTFAHAFFH